MSNLVQRIIMFVLFIPALVALILLLPQGHHLALQLVVILVTAGLSLEIARIWGVRPGLSEAEGQEKSPLAAALRLLAIVGTGLSPVLGRLAVGQGWLPDWVIPLSFLAPVFWLYTSQVIRSQQVPLELFSRHTAAYLMILAYPALGMSFFLAIFFLPEASLLLLVFLGSVFLNDTFAYLAGRLFGKYSNHPLRISPNKTTVGFVVGFFASPLVMLAGWFFWPALFPAGPLAAAILGIMVGVLTIAGDLFESGLKRSFGIKDSGTVILGRGGLLDSLDSLIFASPLFYFCYTLINQIPLS